MAPSLYIHIPFCKRKCLYCDFYSVIYDDRAASAYVDAVISGLEGVEGQAPTVYIGGGTPTSLANKLLEKLIVSARKRAGRDAEFTVEANPESIDEEKVRVLLGSGANRLSIGVQSLDERKLKKLGRIHNAHKAVESVIVASRRGFRNISVDLIFGVWDERMEDWRRELDEAAALPVSHLSCYALSYEKATPLFTALKNKSFQPLEDDVVAGMYKAAMEFLPVRGFKQYEVSNFAKEGFRSAHNLRYWDNDEYIGLGASAVSYRDGVRTKNVSDVKEFIRRFDEGADPAESSEKLPPIRRAKETAALKIRTRDGIDFAWFKERTGFDLLEFEKRGIDELIAKDLIKYKKDGAALSGICLKEKGFLFCDTVSSTLL